MLLVFKVEIFWRRALFDGEGKIHCLLYGELLNYDVSEKAQLHLDDFLRDIRYEKKGIVILKKDTVIMM